MAETYDVIVIGLGGMGSAAAYHLARRGKRVLGLERFTPAHDRGSSHGSSRIIRQAYHENPGYVPLVLRSYELWEQLERDTQAQLLTIAGGLYLGTEDSDVVQGSLRSAREHNLAHELLDQKEIRRRFPVLHPRAEDCAVYETQAGFLRPEAAVAAHLGLATRGLAMQGGAALHFEEPVSNWQITNGGAVRVTTAKGTYEAGHLVIAPGAWAESLLKLSLPLHVRRHVMAWFDPPEGIADFSPDCFPIYIWRTGADTVFYGFPATDCEHCGVKAAMHSGGDICTAETIERKYQARDIAEIREQLAAYIPALNGRLLHAATCMYTMTPDEHFIVSRHPDYAQVSVACGFSGHGFKFAPVIGEVLADLAIEGRTKWPIDFLSAERFAG
ncbi:N-methyl-L-tryptophan oxidase [Alloacidobacterium dinghuense]|uniref:N-methyl-L-tryptophan oxidase n=1 Tax=Alloacidobacterium dinghuense TaxID=2763107 RepID=A0A7G8BEU7_9BACT|nr:N-methyl-L-tryptophan oxidase [Alloacidobacterium dinghuense]QNI31067.1 N-methyl-L-tryptophan oxidase [Alloacidobacterium dinghuense]